MSDPKPPEEPGFNRLIQCRHGLMLYNVNDTHVGRSLSIYGEWCEPEVEIFSQILRKGDVAIDVGANIGAHTVPMAKLVGAKGTIIAFEPQRVVFQTLCANIAHNSLANVFCYQSAIGDQPGTILVPPLDPNAKNNFGAFTVSGFQQGEPVGMIRLDDLPIRACRLIKIDVEGMELSVLRGAEQLIRGCMPVLYVENNRPAQSRELIRFIHLLGYDLYWHDPPLFNPNNFFKSAEDIFAGERAQNMLCWPHQGHMTVQGLRRVEV